ncbi:MULTISPECIES: glutamate racemase [Kitasatospora]|uniref:Aspartate/glutamate racemase family protein n=1 Tax=Kitasatospora cystarginea TaxID=58350 RepID=A0ABN3ESN5_9ACTN
MKIALMDSGIGLLAAAAAVRHLRPDADLVLSSAPDTMPWGPRTPEDVTAHALACARAAAAQRPDALVVACNTASVRALEALRVELEPDLPVIGTVPAIKPAAAGGGRVAIWATPSTTGSPYQRRLIEEFGGAAEEITEIACPGLADAIEHGDDAAIDAAIANAAARTPAGTDTIVLGCTHYELVEDRIRAAVGQGAPGPVCFGSAVAVAAQVLRRIGSAASTTGGGTLTVLHSGRVTELPAAASNYAQGRALVAPVPAAG